MSIYSSAFDPRHFVDHEADTVAFMEFFFALLFNNTLLIEWSGIFDNMSLHNIWSSYYLSFENNSDLYIENDIMPLRIVLDQSFFGPDDTKNIPGRLTQSYLLGGLGRSTDIPTEAFEFLVLNKKEHQQIRHHRSVYELSLGNFDCLSEIRNTIFYKSIRGLNDYCNRFQPLERRSATTPIDMLSFYLKPIMALAESIKGIKPEVSGEILEGAKSLSRLPAFLRQSTATLTAHAKACMPTYFETVVIPFARALRSQARASFLCPDMHVNYELNSIMMEIDDLYVPFSIALSKDKQIDSLDMLLGEKLKLSNACNIGKAAAAFDWDAFHNIILSPNHQQHVRAVKSAITPSLRADAMQRCIDRIYSKLDRMIQFEIDKKENGCLYLSLRLNEPSFNDAKYVTRLTYNTALPKTAGIGNALLEEITALTKQKASLRAICAVRGAV